MAPSIHFALVLADALDRVTDEMPESVCEQQRLTLCGLARALELTATQLKDEAAARERRAMEGAS